MPTDENGLYHHPKLEILGADCLTDAQRHWYADQYGEDVASGLLAIPDRHAGYISVRRRQGKLSPAVCILDPQTSR